MTTFNSDVQMFNVELIHASAIIVRFPYWIMTKDQENERKAIED